MKNTIFYVASLFLIFAFAACNNPSKNRQESENNRPEPEIIQYYKRMEGSIGDQKGILQLVKYQSLVTEKGALGEDRYQGIFLKDADGKPYDLAGFRLPDSSLQLITYDHYNPVDTFRGSFSKGSFEGKVTDTLGQVNSFKFKEKYPEGSFSWKVAAYSDSLFYDSTKTGDAKAKTILMSLWPGSDMEASGTAFIKDTISKSWFGMKQSFNNADTLLSAASDTFLYRYRQAADDWKRRGDGAIGPSFNWIEQAHVDMIYNRDSIAGLRFTQYQFTGGAHGLQSVFCLVADMKKGRPLKLSDIFKPGYEGALRDALEEELRKQYDIPEKEALNGRKGILFDPHLPVSNNFYLTAKGIGFIYNPYEVAPYVVGEIDLYIPFNSISKILKK